MTTPMVYLGLQDTAFIEFEEDGKQLFRKQLIYPGQFTDSEGNTFDVSKQDIDHWVQINKQMRDNGIDVPVPLGHTDNPELRRGTVLALEASEDEKGRYSLYGLFDFGEDSSPVKRQNNVSIYVPPSYRDGKRNEYYRPVRHVALTDYPVVPDLQGFEQAIVASLVPAKKKGKGMDNLIQLLNDELGLMLEPDANEATVYASLRTKLKEMETEIEALKAKVNGDDPPSKEEGEGDDPPKEVSASLIKLVTDSRESKINSLVDKGKITGAVAKKLKDQFVTKESATMAFSQDGAFKEDKSFDGIIGALSLNEQVIKFGEKSGPQKSDGEKNPLLVDAESRSAK